MRRFLLGLSLVLVALLALAVIAPLFIDPRPAPGAASGGEIGGADYRVLRIPFPGTAGLELHYRDSGPHPGGGPAFVLLHGFTFNLATWGALFDFFAAQGRVAAYDQLPYGLSEKRAPGTWSAGDPYAKAAAIEQLFAFMDELGIERAILVGNSAGGTLALEAALARPARVSALILIDPWIYSRRPILPRWLAESPQMTRLTLFLARQLGTKMPLLELSYADPTRVTAERRAQALNHTALAGWDVAWGALLRRSLMEPVTVSTRLAAVTQPILLISGNDDRIVPIADTARAARAVPQAEFAVLPDCGHVPQEECPSLVIAVIANWLRTLEHGATEVLAP